MKKGFLKEYAHIEEEFFDIDKEKKIAYVKLHFQQPTQLFDESYVTKKPILSDDFMEWIVYVFDMIPANYKIDIDVTFDDIGGFDEAELQDIFHKNIMAERKTSAQKELRKKRIAFSLIGIGLLFFVSMLLINHLLVGSRFQEIFSYVADIATTVTFWEAFTILVVESREERGARTALSERFSAIHFSQETRP